MFIIVQFVLWPDFDQGDYLLLRDALVYICI